MLFISIKFLRVRDGCPNYTCPKFSCPKCFCFFKINRVQNVCLLVYANIPMKKGRSTKRCLVGQGPILT